MPRVQIAQGSSTRSTWMAPMGLSWRSVSRFHEAKTASKWNRRRTPSPFGRSGRMALRATGRSGQPLLESFSRGGGGLGDQPSGGHQVGRHVGPGNHLHRGELHSATPSSFDAKTQRRKDTPLQNSFPLRVFLCVFASLRPIAFSSFTWFLPLIFAAPARSFPLSGRPSFRSRRIRRQRPGPAGP